MEGMVSSITNIMQVKKYDDFSSPEFDALS